MLATRCTLRLSLLVPLVCLAAPSVATAQEVSATEHDVAVTNFQAGRRFVEQGNCKDAIPRFAESLRHEQSVGARFNLAECSRAEQHSADAWNQFKQAEQIAIQKRDAERRDAAQKAIAELEPKVLKLRMTLPTDVNDLVVKIDGRQVAEVDYALLATSYAVEPGQPHHIDVTATNRAPWTKTNLQGAAGAELPAITVDLGPPVVVVGAGQRMAGLIVGGVGVAGLVVGSVFGILASGARGDAKTSCVGTSGGTFSYPSPCDPAGKQVTDDKNSTAKSDALLSTIAFVAGGVLIAGGAVLYFTAPKEHGKEAARLHLAPAVGPGTAGAMLGGTF
jgi:hypothetical protein